VRRKTSGKSGGRRTPTRTREPYAWLGVGALCLGVGAALSAGAGVATADSNPTDASPTSRSQAAGPTSPNTGSVRRSSSRQSRASGSNNAAAPAATPAVATSSSPNVPSVAKRTRGIATGRGSVSDAITPTLPDAIPTPDSPRPVGRRDPALLNAITGATQFAAGTTTATPGVTTVNGSAGLVLNLVWNASVSAAPDSFKAAVVQAAELIGARVSDKITLNITVGYGEVDGSTLPSGTAAAGTTGDQWESYATVKQQLIKSATSATDQSVIANLPANNPFNSRPLDVSGAQLKLFGVTAANGSGVDGVMGFSNDWGSSLTGAALHEITHAMGRNAGWGSDANGNWITPQDLFRYASPGALTSDGSLASSSNLQYFSIDGGQTVLANYSTSSDYGDWATNSLTTTDSFNAYLPANSNSLTPVDLLVLDAIGYTIVGAGAVAGRPIAASPATIAAAQSTNQTTGLVAGLLGFTNPDTSAITYSVTAKPANGTVTVTAAGAYSYTPNAAVRQGTPGTPLTDGFSVTATNAGGSTGVAVAVPITGPPIAATPATITAGQSTNQTTGVVTGPLGFINPDTGTISYAVTTGPVNGKVTVTAAGAYTYTPNAPARLLSTRAAPLADGFTVTATNATGGTVVTVTVPIAASISGPPIAASPSTIAANQSTNQITGVVTGQVGFTNPGTGIMTYAVTTKPANGAVSVTDTGTYTYTPSSTVRQGNPGTPLTDSFSITATNAAGSTATGITVRITGRPIAATPAAITAAQQANQITGVVTGQLGFINPDTGPMTYSVGSNPGYGTLTIKADGSYTYTPGSSRRTLPSTDRFSVIAINATGMTAVRVAVPLVRPAATKARITSSR